MTSSVLMRLCNIALKPGISASTQLITTRRICRIVSERLDSITAERRPFVARRTSSNRSCHSPKRPLRTLSGKRWHTEKSNALEREPSCQGLESRSFSTVRDWPKRWALSGCAIC